MDENTTPLGGDQTPGSELFAGARVGAWRVLRVIGRGGMGEVYLAERADASFDKRVALKIVQGMMTPGARARFASEKQALARLEHPHIARLIDAGESSVGWPYLVMEYVEGEPIDRYLAGRNLREVLTIFLQVCEAAAYAHRQLVLHRDIKPNNILVNGDGDAKLLDFGIAKLLQSAEGPEESRTVERAYTPEYASPEQVFGRPIGVASDIYSLGVLLHRLLTGLSPYTFDPGDGAALARALTEDAVVPPSRVVLGASVLTDGERRKRARQLSGDLDTIVLTALRKPPERRYASVDALADDIRRHQANEPIRAQPDSLRYRTGKFLRRNALMVAAALAVTLALVGGLISSMWQANIAEHQRLRAEQEREQAEKRFEDVRSLAHAMIFDLHDAMVTLPGSASARALLVHQALNYLQRLGDGSDAPLPLRRELAEAWLRVGDVQGAPSMPNLGDLHGALKSYEQAASRIDAVLRAMPGDRDAQTLQARVLLHRADALVEDKKMSSEDGDYVEADQAYRRVVGLWMQLRKRGVSDPDHELARAQAGLGDVLARTLKFDDALKIYASARSTLQADGPGKATMDHELFLGLLEVRQGDVLAWDMHDVEAQAVLEDGLGRLVRLKEANPTDATMTYALGSVWVKAAEMMEGMNKWAVLVFSLDERTLTAAEAAANPMDMRAKRSLALSEHDLGDAFLHLGRMDDAAAHYQDALRGEREVWARDPAGLPVAKGVTKRDPRNPAQEDMARTLRAIATLQLQRH